MNAGSLLAVIVGTLAAVLVVQLLIAHHFDSQRPDGPCVPDGACAAGLRCAQHDSTVQWIKKGQR